MWKTAIIALVAMGLVSPCDVSGSAAYQVLLARAGAEIDVFVDAELAAALEELGIHEPYREPGWVDRFLSWIGLGAEPESILDLVSPGWIIRLPDDRVVVQSESTIHKIPGPTNAKLDVVEPTGRVTRTPIFNLGWRGHGARPVEFVRNRSDTLCLVLAPFSGDRQFYAIREDRIVLVRIEDPETGTIRKNEYGAPNWTLGPGHPDLDAAGWRARLDHDDPVTLLEALVWLGGVHLNVHEDPPDWLHEDVGMARGWEEIVTDERTRARLRELAESDDPWIAEAARCAMEIERYP